MYSADIDIQDVTCPITSQIMLHPVILVESGHTYEEQAIKKWLKNHNTDPKSNIKIFNKSWIVDYKTKNIIEQLLKKILN